MFRQVCQHLTESLLLTGIGCLVGAGVAYGGVRFLLALYGATLDARLIWFTVGVALAGAVAAAQVGCAVTLVSAAAELIRSFDRLTRVRTGIGMDNLLTMRVTLPVSKYTTAQQTIEFLNPLVSRLNASPGIASAAAINMLPIQQWDMTATSTCQDCRHTPVRSSRNFDG